MLRHKFTLALNEKLDPNVLKRATVIAASRLIRVAGNNDLQNMQFLTFEDADGAKHEGISALSLVVMKGKSGELRKFREAAADGATRSSVIMREDLLKVSGVEASAIPPEQEWVAVLAFGEIPALNAAAKKLSVWR